MARKPVTNDTDAPIYAGVNATLIPPGQTRVVEVHEALEEAPAEEAGETLQEFLAKLQAGKAADLIAGLPQAPDEAIEILLSLENAAEKPRKTVIEALEFARLERIDAAEQARKEAEAAAATAEAADTADTGETPPPAE